MLQTIHYWIIVGNVGNLETHGVAGACIKRLRGANARQSIHLACREVIRGCVDCADLTGALVLECEAGRCIGAIATAAQGACRLVLACDTLALDTCDAKKIGFQIDHISANITDFCAANKAQSVTALAGAFEFGGHLGVGKHTGRLLVTNGRAVCGSNAIPGAIPWCSGARDVHIDF